MNLILKFLKYSFILFLPFYLLLSCQCSAQEKPKSEKQIRSQNQRIEAQREFLRKERESIKAYIKDRGLDMERTGTGMYYTFLEDSASDEMIKTGDEVAFTYDIYLLNGTKIYSSEKKGVRKLVVDKQDAEIGVHESLKLMSVGDKGLFILPSHLAFGVAGDQIKVPPKTSLAYEIRVLEINKPQKQ
jgi:gliding motility-associated peptidyl-prolyl isomerase